MLLLRILNMKKPISMNIGKISLLLLCLLVGMTGAFAQELEEGQGGTPFKSGGGTFKQYVKKAMEAYANKDYYGAMTYYDYAIQANPNDLEVKYAHAEAAREVGAYTVSEKSYEAVIEKRSENQFPEAEYWLANVKQRLGSYTDAIALYDAFLEDQVGNESVKSLTLQRARKLKMDCEWARKTALTPKDIQIQHLGTEVNSEYNEIAPYLKGDSLFFSTTRFRNAEENGGDARLYTRVMASVAGEEAFEVEEHKFNEIGKHSANTAFSEDLKRVYFTICEYVGETSEIRCDLYYKELLSDGVWSAAIRLPESINPQGTNSTQPSVGYDKTDGSEVLYFSSDMEGGKGGMDIWMSKITPEGDVESPKNVEQVNTEEDELTPFFHTKSQTLFFSSDGHQGLGAQDVFKMKKKDGMWKEIENMGAPVNSSLNDVYFVLNPDGEIGHLSSNRKGANYIDPNKEICCGDLYSLEFEVKVEVLVSAFDNLSKEALAGVTITAYVLNEDGTRTEIAELENLSGNEFPFLLERGKTYILEAKKDGYVIAEEELFIPEDAPDQILQDVYLDPISVDLEVLVYDLDSGLPLDGVTVQLVEISEDGSERIVQEQVNEIGNDFEFPLDRDKRYVIRASKPAYKPLEDLELTTYDIVKSEKFRAEVQLKRTGFLDYLPLAIYFDNDYPVPDSRSKTTEDNYADLVGEYYAKKQEFETLYTEPIPADSAFLLSERYEAFFEREVKKGYEDLTEFGDALLLFLQNGNTVRIVLKGFASPRSTDAYNYNLSSRRIYSVENFFRSYSRGELLNYINSGQFIIERDPIGEEQAPNFVIDRISDERNSIFSLGASLERRVEIIEAEITLSNSGESEFDLKGGER